jgi:hypothetical protein
MRSRHFAAALLAVIGTLALAIALALPATLRASAMSVARMLHTATLLPDGRVLVVGGSPATMAELYDPASDSWIATGATRFQRQEHDAVLLADGRVLVVGGTLDTSAAELYDPATGRWGMTAEMAVVRYRPALALLPGGRVLVVGGAYADAGNEIYDPAANSWAAAAPSLLGPRENDPAAATLPDGRVLVTGGRYGGDTAELYDPTTDSWSLVPLGETLYNEELTPLPDGRVLLTGNTLAAPVASIYDPATGQFSDAARPPHFWQRHSPVALADGQVLVQGVGQFGSETPSGSNLTLLYDPAANRWSHARPPTQRRTMPALALLADGQVLMSGGMGPDGKAMASAERYGPAGSALGQRTFLPHVIEPFVDPYPPPATSTPVIARPGVGLPQIGFVALPNPGSPDRSEEYVEIRNFGGAPVELTGWQLRNISRPEDPAYVFPAYTLQVDSMIVVYSRGGTNDLAVGDFYWGRTPPLWAVGDRAELRDAEGELVHSYVVRAQ